MAVSTEKYAVTRLNNENYFNWRFRVEMLLKQKDLWSFIADDPPVPETDEWKKTNEKAFATIVFTIEDNQIQHVRSCKTAKEAWKALKRLL